MARGGKCDANGGGCHAARHWKHAAHAAPAKFVVLEKLRLEAENHYEQRAQIELVATIPTHFDHFLMAVLRLGWMNGRIVV